jgi:hypothetical protein
VKSNRFFRFADQPLLNHLDRLAARDCSTTAELIECMAEVDSRRLYRAAGYRSMFRYCVGRLHFSEDVAYKRIEAARAVRQHHEILAMIADGRLHLTAVVLLRPYLDKCDASELLAAATHQSKRAIQELIAARFPTADVPTKIRALPVRKAVMAAQPALVPAAPAGVANVGRSETAAMPSEKLDPDPVSIPPVENRPKVTPLAPRRYALQLTMSQRMHDQLRRAQELLSHSIPSSDEAAVLERALDVLVESLEKRKCALTAKPHTAKESRRPRHVPAHVRREVWRRDGGQCTFVSDDGHRCDSRSFLEFDHVVEVARGGRATVEGIRLRCRAHNQLTAELTFGLGFMQQKRGVAATG